MEELFRLIANSGDCRIVGRWIAEILPDATSHEEEETCFEARSAEIFGI